LKIETIGERSYMKQYESIRVPFSILDKVASRAAKLLKESPDPQAEMRWAEKRLEEAGLLNWSPKQMSPQDWAEQVIAQSLDLDDQSVPWLKERGCHPEKAGTFESLVLSLIPSEGGL
jgi:hypothetical protein